MNTENKLPPNSPAPGTTGSGVPPARTGERRNVDRRGADRRKGDRRMGVDRRLGDRRLGEEHGQDWRGKKIGAMRRRTQVLLGILLLCLIGLIIDRYYSKSAGPDYSGPWVKVSIDGIGVWKAKPKKLADYFAYQEHLKKVAGGYAIPVKVQNDQLKARAEALLGNRRMLLENVSLMSWDAFVNESDFYSAGPAPMKPTEAQGQEALKRAEFEGSR